MINLLLGDCLERLRELPDASVDACVTDPPYGLSFMGKGWDHSVPSVEVWREVLRVLKPGAHLLAFFGTRTYHRGVVAIEDAGFEIRDQIGWAFGSGFPKSLDVGKAIEAHLVLGGSNAQRLRERDGRPTGGVGTNMLGHRSGKNDDSRGIVAAPVSTPDAQRWQGWGTALKPAWEPIVVARKPLEGTVAANVLAWGTGAINVDGCRVEGEAWSHPGSNAFSGVYGGLVKNWPQVNASGGRWPANLIHDGSDEVVGLFPVTGPERAAKRGGTNPNPMDWGNVRADGKQVKGHDDAGGSAARFFYCPKASRADREDGLWEFEPKRSADRRADDLPGGDNPRNRTNQPRRCHHPTVKPTDLMRYLCRLVTPPGGVVLDPFMGSGSTGRGAVLEGFSFIGCELDAEYFEIARARIAAVSPEPEPQAPAPAGQLRLW